MPKPVSVKVAWTGVITSVQPRIRLTRSFDQREHSYLGYVLTLQGTIGSEQREFIVAIGEGAHAEHQFRVGDFVSGEGVPVAEPRTEIAELYKVSKVVLSERGSLARSEPPPWSGISPPLPTYRERGHRRLAAKTYAGACKGCIWGCRMPVEMIIDQWNPRLRRYREETFCYGPLSCALHRSGPTRKVPGRKGMSWEEEDWVEQQDVAHRGPDD